MASVNLCPALLRLLITITITLMKMMMATTMMATTMTTTTMISVTLTYLCVMLSYDCGHVLGSEARFLFPQADQCLLLFVRRQVY